MAVPRKAAAAPASRAARVRPGAVTDLRSGKLASPSPAQKAATRRSAYSIEVLRRSIDVLNVFDHARPTLPLKDIVALTGLPKTTVFRVLSTLIEIDMCAHEPSTGNYSLGFGLLRLADVRRRQTGVHEVVLPVMRELRNAVGETVVLSVRAGDARVHIDLVESLQEVRRTVVIGVPAPLYVGASAKVLLAGLADADIEAYLARTPLKAFQNSTITSSDTVWSEVRLIRKRGFAESKGELISGGGSLAAPIRDYSGSTVAAIDILTPESRYSAEHREFCIGKLLAATQKASAQLGFR